MLNHHFYSETLMFLTNIDYKKHNARQMEKTLHLLLEYTLKHKRVYYLVYGINFPKNPPEKLKKRIESEEVRRNIWSNFSENFLFKAKNQKNSQNQNMKLDCKYIMVKEKNKGDREHCHFLVMADGATVQSYNRINKLIETSWYGTLGVTKDECPGLVTYDQNRNNDSRQIKLDTDTFIEKFLILLKRASYLVKTKTKDFAMKKKFSTSQRSKDSKAGKLAQLFMSYAVIGRELDEDFKNELKNIGLAIADFTEHSQNQFMEANESEVQDNLAVQDYEPKQDKQLELYQKEIENTSITTSNNEPDNDSNDDGVKTFYNEDNDISSIFTDSFKNDNFSTSISKQEYEKLQAEADYYLDKFGEDYGINQKEASFETEKISEAIQEEYDESPF